MGFWKAMQGANNAWAKVTCKDGYGTIGPENMIDNRAHKMMITIGTNTTVFGREDVKKAYVIHATSEWIKYSLTLKNGKNYTITFAVFTTTQKGKDFNSGLFTFELWLDGLLYKEPTVATNSVVGDTNAATDSARPATAAQPPKKKTYEEIIEEVKKWEEDEPLPKKTPKQKTSKTTSNKEPDEQVQTEQIQGDTEKENTYAFALQMINARSYEIAYNALSKIKGYKNTNELLSSLENKI